MPRCRRAQVGQQRRKLQQRRSRVLEIELLETIVIVGGLSAVGLLWVGACVGMLQVVWATITDPIRDHLNLGKKD